MSPRLAVRPFALPPAVACGLIAGVVLLASAASAQDDRALGLSLAAEGRCEAALDVLEEIATESAGDAEVAKARGECLLGRQDFRRAIGQLESARGLDPATPEVDLRLAMAYYHADRLGEAAEAIERAQETSQTQHEVDLYAGLIAYAQGDYARALSLLGRARAAANDSVEPMASFFSGRAAIGLSDFERARSDFEKVVDENSDTAWAEEARRMLVEIEDADSIEWWATVELGVEHDDNPLLRGGGVGLPSEIAGQTDQRGFWFVDVGAKLFEIGGASGGALLRYGGSEHAELERFDTHAPGGTLWLDQALPYGGTALRLQYDFDAAWIDASSISDSPFVLSHQIGASLYKPWSGGAFTTLRGVVGIDDYRYQRFDGQPEGSVAPSGPGRPCVLATAEFCGPIRNEIDATDRDGTSGTLGLLHHFPLPFEGFGLAGAWIQGEYEFSRYRSEGSEYDHMRHQVEIATGITLPLAIALRVSGRYAYVPYDNPSVFADPSDIAAATSPGGGGREYFLDRSDRREHETGVRVSLERSFGDRVVLSARYSRSRTRSSADVFRFTRDLVGLSIRVALGG